jgi:enamine deaminase RidA (YjgF/YER057c/UK114 family)
MAIERHEVGPRMSKAVVHGNTVYLAGIVADNPKGKSITEQTKDIVAQVPRATKAMKGARWVRLAELPGEALPNVMRKVLSAALKLD